MPPSRPSERSSASRDVDARENAQGPVLLTGSCCGFSRLRVVEPRFGQLPSVVNQTELALAAQKGRFRRCSKTADAPGNAAFREPPDVMPGRDVRAGVTREFLRRERIRAT